MSSWKMGILRGLEPQLGRGPEQVVGHEGNHERPRSSGRAKSATDVMHAMALAGVAVRSVRRTELSALRQTSGWTKKWTEGRAEDTGTL